MATTSKSQPVNSKSNNLTKGNPVKGNKTTKNNGESDTKKPKGIFTRFEAFGIVMKANEGATKEKIIDLADKLYCKRTGKTPNLSESKIYYGLIANFFKGYNS